MNFKPSFRFYTLRYSVIISNFRALSDSIWFCNSIHICLFIGLFFFISKHCLPVHIRLRQVFLYVENNDEALFCFRPFHRHSSVKNCFKFVNRSSDMDIFIFCCIFNKCSFYGEFQLICSWKWLLMLIAFSFWIVFNVLADSRKYEIFTDAKEYRP